MADSKSPHDALFKKVFSNPSHSAAALRTALPAQVAGQVDWHSLVLEPGSFVDENLASSHSDLLFSASINQAPGFIYCLFEHQSSFDRWMPLRLLNYVLRILDRHIQNIPDGPLPIVLPVVLHHSETGWKASTSLQDLFGPQPLDPHLCPFVPHFSFALDDLGHLSNEDLKRRAWPTFATLATWVLRDARNKDRWVNSLAFWAKTLSAFRDTTQGPDDLVVILRYLYVVNDQLPEHIHDAIAQHVPHIKDIAMTAAEHLILQGKREGILEGKREGILEGKREGILEGKREGEVKALIGVLQARFGAISPDTRNRIAAADEASLERWILRAAVGSSLDFVFADS